MRWLRCGAWLLVLVAGVSPAGAADAPLIEAVKAGHREAVRGILRDPLAVSAAEADGRTALHWAARADDLEMVRLLLAAGAPVEAATRHGVTPLVLAAINGSSAIARALLDAGADPNAVLPEGETVLMTAARTGRPDLVRLLLERGADVHAREQGFGETALIWAAAENHAAAIAVLVEHGTDVNARSARLSPANRRAGQSVLPLGDWTPSCTPRGRVRSRPCARSPPSAPTPTWPTRTARPRSCSPSSTPTTTWPLPCSRRVPTRTWSTRRHGWGRSMRRSTCTGWPWATAGRIRSPPAACARPTSSGRCSRPAPIRTRGSPRRSCSGSTRAATPRSAREPRRSCAPPSRETRR